MTTISFWARSGKKKGTVIERVGNKAILALGDLGGLFANKEAYVGVVQNSYGKWIPVTGYRFGSADSLKGWVNK